MIEDRKRAALVASLRGLADRGYVSDSVADQIEADGKTIAELRAERDAEREAALALREAVG